MPESEAPSASPAQRPGRGPLVAAAVMVALACVLWFTGKRQASQPQYQQSRVKCALPEVTLFDQDGAAVRLTDVLKPDQPTVVNFIYGTCTTISPVLSAGYASLQKQLGAEGARVHLVSITIDPTHDTVPRLKEYLTRYNARPGWDFLTGSRRDIDAVMRAFNAYMGSVESHYAVTFLRAAGATDWVRLQGLINPSDLVREYQKLGSSQAPPGR